MSSSRCASAQILIYDACPQIVQSVMDKFSQVVGRSYRLCDYVGAPDAERVLVMMGSGAEVAQESHRALECARRKTRIAESPLVPAFFRCRHFLTRCRQAYARSPFSIARKSRERSANRFISMSSARCTRARNRAPDGLPPRWLVEDMGFRRKSSRPRWSSSV